MATVKKYGLTVSDPTFTENDCNLKLEMEAIRRGGEFSVGGQKVGLGLVRHYLNFHKICWPEDEQHRWFILGMTGIIENKICAMLGCASSGKTYTMSAHALTDFFCFPRTSLALISSTEIRSLELRIWGRGIKYLFNRARAKFPWLPGFVLESKMAIVPDDIDSDEGMARAINMGIICVPCVSGGKFVGMSKFQGVKPPNSPGKNDGILKHYGDEVAVMHSSFLDAYANWMTSANFKGVMAGNPTDISDPLCTASEPVGGWDGFIDSGTTQTWRSRWHNAYCIAFDGRDTPNTDPGTRDKFAFLAACNFVKELEATYGADSWQLYQQGIGKPSKNMVSNRVITIGLCERHKAFDFAIWKGSRLTRIYHVDPAYGGGDRCAGTESVFGEDQDGNQVFAAGQPEIIPIRLNYHLDAEGQIAAHMKQISESRNIPPQNMFYDSFGRGTLGFELAKVFGSNCPVPVDSGARCTDRPVRFDLYVPDGKHGRRLKMCHEHYSKFVTEMWFSVREIIESDQMRNLARAVAEEGQSRLYRVVMGNKVEVESKDEMKERIKKSPDLFDCLAIGIEGARRLGFQIKRIGAGITPKMGDSDKWLLDMAKKRDKESKSKRLVYS